MSIKYFKIHKEGYIFAFLFAIAGISLYLIFPLSGLLFFPLTLWCLYFFRNPDRVTPTREGLVISPADGVVCGISHVYPPKEMLLEGDDAKVKLVRISIFMNVFNVHVNRVPIEGIIRKIFYHKGKFLNASLDKASEHNERQLFLVENKKFNIKIIFVQIAGLIARRIRCDIIENQQVKTGERFGLIRFGSRVDVYLPATISPLVIKGQIMIAGETVLADLTSVEAPRDGHNK